jgi:hypothetical protein
MTTSPGDMSPRPPGQAPDDLERGSGTFLVIPGTSVAILLLRREVSMAIDKRDLFKDKKS